MIKISSSTAGADVPVTSVAIAVDERLYEHPHPCRKRGHTGSEIGFERWPRRRLVEELGELALDPIARPATMT